MTKLISPEGGSNAGVLEVLEGSDRKTKNMARVVKGELDLETLSPVEAFALGSLIQGVLDSAEQVIASGYGMVNTDKQVQNQIFCGEALYLITYPLRKQ